LHRSIVLKVSSMSVSFFSSDLYRESFLLASTRS
jgi:hypothetical protein